MPWWAPGWLHALDETNDNKAEAARRLGDGEGWELAEAKWGGAR